MIKHFQVLFLVLLVIASIRVFDANFIDPRILNYSAFIFATVGVLISAPYFFSKSIGFVFPIQLMVVSIAMSVFMAYFSWGQSIKESAIETVPLLLWIIFFYLRKAEISIITIQNIVLFYGAIYAFLYFFQYFNSGSLLFGKSLWGDSFIEDRGIIRIVFPGGGLFFLAVFIAINKLTTQASGKIGWMAFTFVGLIIPLMQVTRVYILAVLLLFIFHFAKSLNVFKLAFISVFLLLFTFYSASQLGLVKGLVTAHKETIKEGSKNIRVLAGTYFLYDFSPDEVNRVLGNGVPVIDASSYGRFVSRLNDEGFFLEDVGIIAVYAMYGVLGVLAYILIWLKSFTISIPAEHQYVKYYLWFLLFTGLTTSNLYSHNFLISTVFSLYIYQTILEKEMRLRRWHVLENTA